MASKEDVKEEKKKILFLITKWEGGVGSIIKTYSKYLERMGYKVYVVSRDDDLECYSLRDKIFKIRKVVKKRKYDAIISNDWSMALPLLYPWPVRFKKHYCIFHGTQDGAAGMLQKYVGWVMETFGRLIVVSEKLKEKFKKAKVVENCVDDEIFKVLNNPEIERDVDKVGFANWVSDLYNYDVVKEAVEKEGKKLVVAEGLNKKEMVKFYNEVGMVISLPPKGAGFNLVWLEAIACGVPKVIGNYEGVGGELPISKIEEKNDGTGKITVDEVRYAMKNAKNISIKERMKVVGKYNHRRMCEELLEIIGLEEGEESGEEE